jgi:cytochrome c oxidase subunit III
MSPETGILTPAERDELELTALVRYRLEPQFENLEQQHEVAALGMWIFLATEIMFFGTLFVGLGTYRYWYEDEFDRASEHLNWIIGGINTVVLLVSSLFMALAVHYAKHGRRERVVRYLALTAVLGVCFLVLKGYEYYTDYRDNLIPGWRFDDWEWIDPKYRPPDQPPPGDQKANFAPVQVPHVELFLLFYWTMTGLHALHVTIGVVAVGVMAVLAHRGVFDRHYYSPVDVTGLYWHFVDTVWIFLLPMLYLLGTHTMQDFHF